MWGAKTPKARTPLVVLPSAEVLQSALAARSERRARAPTSPPPEGLRRSVLVFPTVRLSGGEPFVLLISGESGADALSAVCALDLSTADDSVPFLDKTLESATRAFLTCHGGFFRSRSNHPEGTLSWTLMPCVNFEEDWALAACFVDVSTAVCPLTCADEWQLFHAARGDDETSLRLHWVPLRALSKLTMEDPFSPSGRTKHLEHFGLDPLLTAAFSLPSLRRHTETRMLRSNPSASSVALKAGLDEAEQAAYGTLEPRTLRTPTGLRGLRGLKVLPRSLGSLATEFWTKVHEQELAEAEKN